MRPHADRPGSAELPTGELRLKRVLPGDEFIFKALTDTIPGCLTHWVKKRSAYCGAATPAECSHKLDCFWKGYVPVYTWDDAANLWVPFVLEVTEHLEHALRPHFKRGTIWRVKREVQLAARKTPVTGELLEVGNAQQTPDKFVIDSTLWNVYHVKVELGAKNPVPMLPRVQARSDAPPTAVLATRASEAPHQSSEDETRARRIRQIQLGQIPRGKYPELDAIAFATLSMPTANGHTNGNGRHT